jgi:Domain of unknown function (DUF1918)
MDRFVCPGPVVPLVGGVPGASPLLGGGGAFYRGATRLVTRREIEITEAHAGDKILIRGHHVGEPEREALILEVRGADGGPPYVVKWLSDGHEGLFFPGSDATIEHRPEATEAKTSA